MEKSVIANWGDPEGKKMNITRGPDYLDIIK